MKNVDEILAKSTYVPTEHGLKHTRKDGRDLWFAYKDIAGRGGDFKVCWNKNIKKYELYSVVDKLEKNKEPLSRKGNVPSAGGSLIETYRLSDHKYNTFLKNKRKRLKNAKWQSRHSRKGEEVQQHAFYLTQGKLRKTNSLKQIT